MTVWEAITTLVGAITILVVGGFLFAAAALALYETWPVGPAALGVVFALTCAVDFIMDRDDA